MTEEVKQIITALEQDILYFKSLEFSILAEKFTRDLNIIKDLSQQTINNGGYQYE